MMMMTFICSCRNNKQSTAMYPLGTFLVVQTAIYPLGTFLVVQVLVVQTLVRLMPEEGI
jgi:hypothetical protein